MENKNIIDFKDYVLPDIENDIEFQELILEDIKGRLFRFKYRKPTTSELIKVRRIATGVKITEKEEVITNIEYETGFNYITNNFDCLPKQLEADMLKEKSVRDVVDTFLSNS